MAAPLATVVATLLMLMLPAAHPVRPLQLLYNLATKQFSCSYKCHQQNVVMPYYPQHRMATHSSHRSTSLTEIYSVLLLHGQLVDSHRDFQHSNSILLCRLLTMYLTDRYH